MMAETVGARILVAAKIAGLSREDLKREVTSVTGRHIDRYVARLKEGEDEPKVPHYVIAQVASATGVSADYLVGAVADPLPLKRATPPAAPSSRQRLRDAVDEPL